MSEQRTKRWVMVIDSRKCIDCKACDVACKRENRIDAKGGRDVYRNWISSRGIEGSYPHLKQRFEPGQCQHCTNTPCRHVCPTGATYVTAEGVVRVDYDRCIVCSSCITACPYDARYVSRQLKAVDKCTFCEHRIGKGLLPACVETCPAKVRTFGDLNDPDSEVSRILANRHYFVLKPEVGTKPNLYYIS